MKIAVASGKGGVGKSMLASAVAMLFAQDKKIVAVDCDVDAPNLHLWLGLGKRGLKSANTNVVAQFIARSWDEVEKISTNQRPVIDYEKCDGCGKCVEMCQFGALEKEDVVAQFTARPGERGLKSATTSRVAVNPYLCEGCGACAAVCPQKAIKMVPVENAEIRIKNSVHGFPLVSAQLYPGHTGSGKIVEEIKKRAEDFDHQVMILDAPAGTGCPVIAALKDADFVILVTEPTPSGLSDLQRTLTAVNHFQIPFGVVINKWDINPPLTQKIEKEFGGKILGKIAYDKKIFEAIANLTPVMETNLPAVKEIKNVIAHFLALKSASLYFRKCAQ
jgi:MinD superfamily P-loop ATPase